MNNQEYVLNAYKNALERVSAEIKRKPNQTEEALIFSSILLTILSMGIWGKPSNVMGRACAMSLFRFITFNADESYPSITQKYRQKLCLSQKDLDIQMVKAIEKAHQDPLYDSSTVRTLIMSARAFCFELETHRLVNEYNTYQEFADSVLQVISPVLANNLKNSYPHDPNIVNDAMSLIQKYKEFAIETDDINAMLLVA